MSNQIQEAVRRVEESLANRSRTGYMSDAEHEALTLILDTVRGHEASLRRYADKRAWECSDDEGCGLFTRCSCDKDRFMDRTSSHGWEIAEASLAAFRKAGDDE
jgi:hypothetical protein